MGIRTNRYDLSYVMAELQDDAGDPIEDGVAEIQFSVKGQGELARSVRNCRIRPQRATQISLVIHPMVELGRSVHPHYRMEMANWGEIRMLRHGSIFVPVSPISGNLILTVFQTLLANARAI